MATKKTSSRGDGNWFTKKSKAAQLAYIKAHPNSKYAKGSKSPNAKSTGLSRDDKKAIKGYEAKLKMLQAELEKDKWTPHQKNGIRANIRTYKNRIAMRKRAAQRKRDAKN